MSAGEEVHRLREELDALRLANAALEAQMLAGAEEADAMLREVEAQRNALRDANRREGRLLAFTQRVMDAVASVVMVLGPDGRVRQDNRYARERLGTAQTGLIGQVLDEFLHPMERDALDEALPALPWPVRSALFETVRRHGGYRAEHRLAVRDGSWGHFLVDAAMLYDARGVEEGAVVNAVDITALKEQALRLLASEARLEEAQEVARLGSWQLDPRSGQAAWSREVHRIFETDPGGPGVSFETFIAAVHPEDRDSLIQAYTASLATRNAYELEHRLLFADGRVKWVHGRCVTHYDAEGVPLRSVGTVQDVTARKQAEEDVRLAASVFENSLNGILITTPDGTICKINRAFTEITGYTETQALGATPRLLKSGLHDDAFYRHMWETLLADGKWEGEVHDRRQDGQVVPVWQSISPVRNGKGDVTHYIGIFYDISEQKASAERVYRLAHYDVLTGLPNRTLLLDRCERALVRARREAGRFAVLFLDLDRFKHINDSLGHPVGDELLRAVALRLQASLREHDTIARLGGDEFVVLAENVEANHDAVIVAEKLLAAFVAPFEVRAHALSVGTTIGISLYPDHGDDVTGLIKHADLALYQGKAHGRGCYRFFETELTELATERMRLESDLRQALQRGELTVHYQPLHALQDDRMVGAEALLRWQHPERGLVPPDSFIPIAEDTGLIIPIGAWVLERACRQAQVWRREGLPLDTIAVNLSGIQIQRGEIVSSVERVLAETGLPATCLELEITETYLMRHMERDLRELEALHALGVRLAIDDFGTGQSSLSYLKRLPVSKLKIDRSFIADIALDSSGATITRAILGLGRELHMAVVAEGVETAEQEACLRRLRCDLVQGFRYSRPLDAGAFRALLVRACPGSSAAPA